MQVLPPSEPGLPVSTEGGFLEGGRATAGVEHPAEPRGERGGRGWGWVRAERVRSELMAMGDF